MEPKLDKNRLTSLKNPCKNRGREKDCPKHIKIEFWGGLGPKTDAFRFPGFLRISPGIQPGPQPGPQPGAPGEIGGSCREGLGRVSYCLSR